MRLYLPASDPRTNQKGTLRTLFHEETCPGHPLCPVPLVFFGLISLRVFSPLQGASTGRIECRHAAQREAGSLRTRAQQAPHFYRRSGMKNERLFPSRRMEKWGKRSAAGSLCGAWGAAQGCCLWRCRCSSVHPKQEKTWLHSPPPLGLLVSCLPPLTHHHLALLTFTLIL